MGAPKLKWTAEEEAALKAGVLKHGTGKWRTMLMDPEFSGVLHSRSNVDLKDKWRNINVTAIWGSRQKAKLALKTSESSSKSDGKALALTPEIKPGNENPDAKPPAISSEMPTDRSSKEPVIRLDSLIVEAVTKLKDPSGLDKESITSYIKEECGAPPKIMKRIGTKLKVLTESGKLIKVNHKYKIAPSSSRRNSGQKDSSKSRRTDSTNTLKPETPKAENGNITIFTKPQIDAELLKMRSMTPEEAAASAARAVAEAEIAIATAEAAAREAEEAEAEAEAAQIFAKAAIKALEYKNLHPW